MNALASLLAYLTKRSLEIHEIEWLGLRAATRKPHSTPKRRTAKNRRR